MAKISGVSSVLGGLVALGALAGCSTPNDWGSTDSSSPPGFGSTSFGSTPLFEGKTQQASSKVAPIAGGTLLITKDGHAVASDPDRDLVHVVDLATQKVVSVEIQAGDEPGRVVEGAAGTAYVVARRGGAVLAIDTAQGTVSRIPVCAAPRGIVYDSALAKLYVACRSGVLATIDEATQAITDRMHLDPDLRDVVISNDNLVVTRFKTAEVMVVGRDGKVLRRSQPVPKSLTGASVTPGVAYRAMSLPGGGVLVGHVNSSNTTLPSGAGAYYGAQCGGSVADLSVSVVDASGAAGGSVLPTTGSNTLGGASGPLDVALSLDGARVAVLATGNSWSPTGGGKNANLWITGVGDVQASNFNPSCGGFGGGVNSNTATNTVDGEPVAVAFDQGGHWVVQSREPAQLRLEDNTTISLAPDSRFDTGFAMFHMNTGGAIACSSCHPEAGEDGHTWQFSVGPRRSQTLEGGASTRAPFHWAGDLSNWDALVDEVMLKRMSLAATVDKSQRAALSDWLDSVPKSATADDLDPAAVERGQAIFSGAETACATCHSGPDFTDNKPHNVGTGAAFITPSLVDVNMRAPLFHDGCSVTLEGRFGPCGGGDAHGITSKLTKADEADLLSFMRSL
jgi:mono/diheme cytochrome c family protein